MIKEIHEVKAICDICGCESTIKNRLDREDVLRSLALPMREFQGSYAVGVVEVCEKCAEEIAQVLNSHYHMYRDEYGDVCVARKNLLKKITDDQEDEE